MAYAEQGTQEANPRACERALRAALNEQNTSLSTALK